MIICAKNIDLNQLNWDKYGFEKSNKVNHEFPEEEILDLIYNKEF